MIGKWRLGLDHDISDNTIRCQSIKGVITYITDIEEEDRTDGASLITKAHKIVLMFKFIASFYKMEIEDLPMKNITRYLKIVKVDSSLEFEYFAELLT